MYIQVRDRHNGNILLDTSGRIVHVDYGYILGDSPGFNINFENVPFKLTKEYMDLLGGEKSTLFRNFVDLFTRGFFALRQNIDIIVTAVEVSKIHINLLLNFI
jgi:phosphatidylinositol 4-kinase